MPAAVVPIVLAMKQRRNDGVNRKIQSSLHGSNFENRYHAWQTAKSWQVVFLPIFKGVDSWTYTLFFHSDRFLFRCRKSRSDGVEHTS